MKTTNETYIKVIEIATEYLGPAAPRFIDRQIQNHLKKQPSQLKQKDLPILTDWSKLALSLITKDQTVVEEFAQKLLKLNKLTYSTKS